MARRTRARREQTPACPVEIIAPGPPPAPGRGGRLGQAVEQLLQLVRPDRAFALDGTERRSGVAASEIVKVG